MIYFEGKLEVLNRGDEFKLAGLELSKYSNNSPFYYKGDIIRLPNGILEYVNKPNLNPPRYITQKLITTSAYRCDQSIDYNKGIAIATIEETKDDKDYSTLILLITVIVLQCYIIIKLV